MEFGRKASLASRIQRAQSTTDIDAIARELVSDGGTWPDELLSALASKIQAGISPLARNVAEVIVLTRNRELYEAARSVLLGDDDSCIYLMANGVRDPAIEESLCSRLPDAGATWRVTIVRALGDYGTNRCRETLYGLEYEMQPAYRAANEVLNSLSPEDLERRSNIQRVLDLKETVLLYETVVSSRQSVVARNQPPATEWEEGSVQREGFFDIAESHFANAERHIQKQNEESEAMGDLRKATEALLKAWIKRAIAPHAWPPELDSMQLEGLNQFLVKSIKPPKPISQISHGIQHATNPTTHDQGTLEQSEFLTRAIAEGHMDGWRRLHDYAAKMLSDQRRSSGTRD